MEGKIQQKDLTQPQLKIKTQSKKNYQFIWRSVFVFISIVSAFLFNKIYLYQTLQFFEPERKGSIYELFVYGVPFGFVFIAIEVWAHKYLDQKFDKFYLSHQRYKTEQSRQKRCYTLLKWAYSLIYYGISSVAAYFILRQTTFLPTWMGGEGYCTDVTRYINTFDEANDSMKIFYILQFGKHLGRFFQHLFIRSEGNFYEYALHHGLSTFLIFFSYLMNMWIIGIFVLFIHDLSDFFLILGRGYRDFKYLNRSVLKFVYVTGGFSWVACRIFLLSFCCVYSSLSSAYHLVSNKQLYNPTTYEVYLFPGFFMAFMLLALQILQIFWTYYIITAFIQVNVSQKIAKHTYD